MIHRLCFRRAALLSAGLIWLAIFSAPALAITVEFDYRFDRGFFTTAGGDPIAERRAALEAAGQVYVRLLDSLDPIDAGIGNSWSATFRHPSWSSFFEIATVENESIAVDTIKLFVGGSPSSGSVLGIAEAGTLDAQGSAAFQATVHTRGEAGAALPIATDFGPWGGSIWFNSNIDWYFGLDAAGLGATQSDFLTTATHEIGHLLGFGEALAWSAQITNAAGGTRVFTGIQSMTIYGAPVPVDANAAHWLEGVLGSIAGQSQETLMDPTTSRGQRELMTDLDFAGLADIGWQVSAVPEPDAALTLVLGLLTIWVSVFRGARSA